MDKTLGLYIHIPFCASKCGYCDFYSVAGCDSLMPKYQNALLEHIREASPRMSPYYIDTLYFGGGTPSYYGAKRICEIFNTLKKESKVLKSAEVTVEANPDSVTLSGLRALREEGVNRLSIGAQSANSDILKIIGRRHNWKQVEKAFETARAVGFDNVSIDLIYGLPGQTKEDWADTLSKALALHPQHVSCYGLKLEEGTPMYQYKDSPFLPTDDEQADMYLYTVETLESYGFRQYEISNFALSGYESRHNIKYWTLQDYMGFGPGAHSCVDSVRYSYIKDIGEYISGVLGEKNIIDEYEKIGLLERAGEYLMLGMRMNHGISGEEYYSIYRSDFRPIEYVLKEFEKHGWAKTENGRWFFTSSGFLLSNILIGALLEAQSRYKLSGNPWINEKIDTYQVQADFAAASGSSV